MAEETEEPVRACCICGEPATFRIAMQIERRTDDTLEVRLPLCFKLWFFCRPCAFEKQNIEWQPLYGKPLSEGQMSLTGNA